MGKKTHIKSNGKYNILIWISSVFLNLQAQLCENCIFIWNKFLYFLNEVPNIKTNFINAKNPFVECHMSWKYVLHFGGEKKPVAQTLAVRMGIRTGMLTWANLQVQLVSIWEIPHKYKNVWYRLILLETTEKEGGKLSAYSYFQNRNVHVTKCKSGTIK